MKTIFCILPLLIAPIVSNAELDKNYKHAQEIIHKQKISGKTPEQIVVWFNVPPATRKNMKLYAFRETPAFGPASNWKEPTIVVYHHKAVMLPGPPPRDYANEPFVEWRKR